MTFEKSCGKFTLTCSEPSPVWVRITTEYDGNLGCLHIADLHDLRYLIDRALAQETTK